MKAKIIIPQALCQQEAIIYVARRYGTTPEHVMEHYLVQDGIIKPSADLCKRDNFELAPNEIELFRDLGVKPCEIEYSLPDN